MKRVAVPILIVLIVGCSGNLEDTNQSDKSNESEVEMDSPADSDSTVHEPEPETYRKSKPGGTIHVSEQIMEDDYWLYFKEMNLYSNSLMTEDSKIGTVPLGSKVKFLNTEYTHMIDDHWFVGNPVKVKLSDGQEGYMWNHYLVQIPYPADQNDSEYTGIQWYLNHALYSGPQDSTIYEGAKIEGQVDWEGKWEKVTFNYEKGISYSESEYYESAENVLFLRDMNIQDGYLLLDALVDDVEMMNITGGLPQEENGEFEHTEYDGCVWSADVEFDEMFTIVNWITFNLGDGCGEWYTVREVENGVEIELGSGC